LTVTSRRLPMYVLKKNTMNFVCADPTAKSLCLAPTTRWCTELDHKQQRFPLRGPPALTTKIKHLKTVLIFLCCSTEIEVTQHEMA